MTAGEFNEVFTLVTSSPESPDTAQQAQPTVRVSTEVRNINTGAIATVTAITDGLVQIRYSDDYNTSTSSWATDAIPVDTFDSLFTRLADVDRSV